MENIKDWSIDNKCCENIECNCEKCDCSEACCTNCCDCCKETNCCS